MRGQLFALLYVFIIYSSVIKTFFPVDVTILSFSLLVFLSVFMKRGQMKVSKGKKQLILLFSIIYFAYLFTSLYTISLEYYQVKALKFTMAFVLFVLGILFLEKKHLKSILYLFYLSLIVYLVFLLITGVISIGSYQVIEVGYTDYLSFSFFLVVNYFLFIDDYSPLNILVKVVTFLFLIILSARFLVGVFVLFNIFFYIKKTKLKSVTFLYGAFGLSILGFLFAKFAYNLTELLFFRYNALFKSGEFKNDRSGLFEIALEGFYNNPIGGIGIGGFGTYSIGKDIRYYPHNIFLEFLVESGFGITLLVVIFFLLFIRNMKNYNLRWILSALVVFLDLQKSSGIADIRIYLSLLVIILVLGNESQKEEDTIFKKMTLG